VENDTANFLGRLIPFQTEPFTTLSLLPVSTAAGAALRDPVANAMPADVAEQESAIVSQAVTVLDEEMARGVLAARQARPSYRASDAADPGNVLLRQVHDVVDQVAAAWPVLQGVVPNPRNGRSQPLARDVDPLAELRSPATVRAGQRATISMAVYNSENRSVRLVPAATDLLGSRGGRISCSLFEFTPTEFKLESQGKMDVAITLTVPTETAPGCYFGLLVVRGVDYLRALITIEVV
jgi:hypothetical protein